MSENTLLEIRNPIGGSGLDLEISLEKVHTSGAGDTSTLKFQIGNFYKSLYIASLAMNRMGPEDIDQLIEQLQKVKETMVKNNIKKIEIR